MFDIRLKLNGRDKFVLLCYTYEDDLGSFPDTPQDRAEIRDKLIDDCDSKGIHQMRERQYVPIILLATDDEIFHLAGMVRDHLRVVAMQIHLNTLRFGPLPLTVITQCDSCRSMVNLIRGDQYKIPRIGYPSLWLVQDCTSCEYRSDVSSEESDFSPEAYATLL